MPIDYENNFSTQHLSLISSGTDTAEFDPGNGDYIRLNVRNQVYYSDYVVIEGDTPGDITTETDNFRYNDFIIYKDVSGNHYVKPNDLLDQYNFSQGTYDFRIDFLNDLNITH